MYPRIEMDLPHGQLWRGTVFPNGMYQGIVPGSCENSHWDKVKASCFFLLSNTTFTLLAVSQTDVK